MFSGKISSFQTAILVIAVCFSVLVAISFRLGDEPVLPIQPRTDSAELRARIAPLQNLSSEPRSRGGSTANRTNGIEAWNQLIASNFAGDASCAECHREIYDAHLRSGHSRTATRMTGSALASQLLAMETYSDPQRSQTYRFFEDDDQFFVQDVGNDRVPAIPVTWLLGSGTHAQTPIAVDEATQSGVELRWSYLRHLDTLAVTPDQDRFADYHPSSIECFGRPMDAADIRTCLGCHTTTGPPAQLPIRHELYVPNIGCERCHGPRKKHVELAHAGRAAEVPPLLNFSSADSYLANCSQCHRDENSVPATAKPNELVRFQPYGLKRSRCYQADPEKMTCSACHDPHDTVERSRDTYISQCQSCHASNSSQACPDEPTGDCIRCHMPAVEWTAGISFHDHWIRVPGEPPASGE